MFLIVLILVYCLQMKWKIWSKADYTLKIQSLCIFFGPRSKIASKLVTPNLKIPFKPIFAATNCRSSIGKMPVAVRLVEVLTLITIMGLITCIGLSVILAQKTLSMTITFLEVSYDSSTFLYFILFTL